MNLITVSFEMIQEKQLEFIQAFENIVDVWKQTGFTASLFRETGNKNNFCLLLLSENDIDVLTALIQKEPPIRDLFEKMKESECRITVSSMEQIM